MPANPHDEKYRVNAPPTGSTTLRLTVDQINTGGDVPVKEIHIRNLVPPSFSSLTGLEEPQDQRAVIYASASDFAEAKSEIKQGTVISYTSLEVNGVETISHVAWVT